MMDELKEVKRSLTKLKYQAASVRADLRFRKLMRALKEAFNPDQPRDNQGRWSDNGSIEAADDGAGEFPLTVKAARRTFTLAECEAQYKIDTFHCTMVGLPACHRQAAQRYAACLGGTQIPPLSY